MSLIKLVRRTFQALLNFFQQLIQFVSEAVLRIFSPKNDQYPETGVQPFEGEPNNDKKG